MLSPALVRSLKLLRRRVSVAALLVLHVMIAGAELFDPVREVRLDTHAEQHGNRHPFAHDAATCAVCSVQVQHASVPPRATMLITPVLEPAAVLTDAPSVGGSSHLMGRSSRAPPALI